MGTKVPLVAAAHVHSKRAAMVDLYKPNFSGPSDALFSHHLSHSGVPVNGSSNGLYYPPQSTSYGSTFSTGVLDKQAVTRIHSSAERQRRNSVSLLNRVPEDGTMDYDREAGGSRYVVGASLDGDEEEEELEIEEELAAEGLYSGSYWRLLALYTLVPLTFIVVFALLAILPTVVWPIDRSLPPSPFPYPPYLPFPLPEFLLSTALWSFSYLLRDPLYAFATFLTSAFNSASTTTPILFSTAFHSFLSLLLQQSAIPLLLIPYYMPARHPTSGDPAFRRVWWIALGWAAAEAVVGIQQGYEAIALYRDVLISIHRPHAGDDSFSSPGKSQNDDFRLPIMRSPSEPSARTSPVAGNSAIDLLNRGFEDEVYGQSGRLDQDGVGDERQLLLPRQSRIGREESELQIQLERDVDRLLTLRSREELEEVYGMPVINIPVFISCLQRVNAILLSLGVYLLISSAYIRSTLALPSPLLTVFTQITTNTPLKITLPLVFLLQFSLAVLHTSLMLPRIGVHTVVYAGLLLSLGSFFAGLGIWEALS